VYSPPIAAFNPLFDPKLTVKNRFVCEDLLDKKGEKIEERRVLLQKDDRAMPDRGTLLEEKSSPSSCRYSLRSGFSTGTPNFSSTMRFSNKRNSTRKELTWYQ
jgi:hypothetical protein